jgi:hypothetical protein
VWPRIALILTVPSCSLKHFSKGALSSLFLVFGMLDEKGRVFEEWTLKISGIRCGEGDPMWGRRETEPFLE